MILNYMARRWTGGFSLNNFSGTVKENKIEGAMNGGGTPITVDAGGGKINLSFR